LDLQVHLARAAAANHQQLGQLQAAANPLAGPAANLLAHPLLGVSQAGQMPQGPGVFLLPRLP